ncbi:MAG: helix-turn-helix transcriptional regulator [Fimbriimonadaceae bacterium]|nr:helix-turn-helix transcriptional regulator [Chitinophagales bacterium]
MFNFYEKVLEHPDYYRQFNCGESLITIYNCPLENKFVDLWTQHNYIVYVTEGKKIWHTAHGTYELTKESCIFVRKGASIVEQFFDTPFCLYVFFVSDDFICETLKTRSIHMRKEENKKFDPIIHINKSETLQAFYYSMSSYFKTDREPDKSLLELKFKELILTIADNNTNTELLSYFCSLLQEPLVVSMQKIMEDNYCFNLKLEQYATLCNKSLSAFKRDFQKHFDTTPGKWLLEKRLNHAKHLLKNMDKTVSEAAFESGFENPSHFSRSFKERFGISPISAKQKQTA